MIGSEHFWKAERLLKRAADEHGVLNAAELAVMVAEAQVHATLALAAATALATTSRLVGDSQEITYWGQIVQPDAFFGKPCTDGCVDEGRNGCPPRCIAAQAAHVAALTPAELECPF